MTRWAVVAALLIGAATGGARVIDNVQSDLDNDGRTEIVSITCKTRTDGHPMGGDIIVQHREHGKLITLWRQHRLNPWKLQIGDVDGDGKIEVIAGVWKKSPRDLVMAKRTFVYSWNGKRLMPKWLGSRLSRRFDDFVVADLNSDGLAELISLEVAPGGKRRVSVYRWLSFGFECLGSSEEMPGLVSLQASGKEVAVVCDHGQSLCVDITDKGVTLTKGGMGNEMR